MPTNVRRRGSVAIVEVSGNAPAGGGDRRLGKRLAELLDEGECLLIVDLTRRPVFDSAFLGQLVTWRERARKRGGLIKLVVTPTQRDLITASKLDYLFEIYRDEEDALDSFLAENTTAGIP